MYSICISGPERMRAQVEVALEDAHVPVYPAGHHAPMDWVSKLPALPSGEQPAEPHGFLTVEHASVDLVADLAGRSGWVLRIHYPVPEKPQPTEEQKLLARIASLEAAIDTLRAQVGVR